MCQAFQLDVLNCSIYSCTSCIHALIPKPIQTFIHLFAHGSFVLACFAIRTQRHVTHWRRCSQLGPRDQHPAPVIHTWRLWSETCSTSASCSYNWTRLVFIFIQGLFCASPHLNCKCLCVCVFSESGAVPSHCHAHGEHVVSPREETHSATKWNHPSIAHMHTESSHTFSLTNIIDLPLPRKTKYLHYWKYYLTIFL